MYWKRSILPNSTNWSVCCQNAGQDVSLHRNFSYSTHIAIHLYQYEIYVAPDLCTDHCQGEAYTFLRYDIFLSPRRASNTAAKSMHQNNEHLIYIIMMQVGLIVASWESPIRIYSNTSWMIFHAALLLSLEQCIWWLPPSSCCRVLNNDIIY